MTKHCTNCEHFAFWDGDFCCCEKMKLIEGTTDGKFWAILPEAFNANKCNEYEKMSERNVEAFGLQKSYIEYIKTLTNEDLSDDLLLQKYGYKNYK